MKTGSCRSRLTVAGSHRRFILKTCIYPGVVLSCLLLAACATLPRQMAEIRCVEQCQLTKDQCDADARYDYRQCQAGYAESFRAYRWCLAAASERDQCGYPWWSCAENRFGYCTNRYHECAQHCRR